MGKTNDKTKAKVDKANAKTKGRVKKAVAKSACVLLLAMCAVGCMHPGEQAAKSETMNVTIKDSVIAVNIGAKKSTANCVSNTVEMAAESERTYDVTILSQAQSLESSGTETFGQTQTPTMDIKPDIDVRYNDALAAASNASKGVLESLTAAGANKVLAMMADKSTGTVEVTKKDGTTATVECKDGQCSFSDTGDACADGNCTAK